jgi:hypothetical protein
MDRRGIEVVIERLDAGSLSAAERRRIARARLRHLLDARSTGVPSGTVQFSHSRSGDLAAYAFTREHPVGVDIEEIRPLTECDAIAARVFPLREHRRYEALPRRSRLRGFFRGWTRTEALAKALGGGLPLGPQTLERALAAGWMVCSFIPAAGFAGAVAFRQVIQ